MLNCSRDNCPLGNRTVDADVYYVCLNFHLTTFTASGLLSALTLQTLKTEAVSTHRWGDGYRLITLHKQLVNFTQEIKPEIVDNQCLLQCSWVTDAITIAFHFFYRLVIFASFSLN